jgi:hypothetical protein
MEHGKDERHWNPFSKKIEPFKRRALGNPIYVPARFGLAYLDSQTILNFLPNEDEYTLKKQKLDNGNSQFEREIVL